MLQRNGQTGYWCRRQLNVREKLAISRCSSIRIYAWASSRISTRSSIHRSRVLHAARFFEPQPYTLTANLCGVARSTRAIPLRRTVPHKRPRGHNFCVLAGSRCLASPLARDRRLDGCQACEEHRLGMSGMPVESRNNRAQPTVLQAGRHQRGDRNGHHRHGPCIGNDSHPRRQNRPGGIPERLRFVIGVAAIC